jgi:hypothetical protein
LRLLDVAGIAAFDGKIGSISERADDRFFWNKSLCSAFIGTQTQR